MLQQQGGSQLVVRLYDIIGIDLSYQKQYESEDVAHDRFVAIPVRDRDYIATIWLNFAMSLMEIAGYS